MGKQTCNCCCYIGRIREEFSRELLGWCETARCSRAGSGGGAGSACYPWVLSKVSQYARCLTISHR